MSLYYSIGISVQGADPARALAIKEAAEAEWPFDADDWYPCDHPDDRTAFGASATGDLCAALTEQELAHRLIRAVWEANGRYCEVEVSATRLHDTPDATYRLGRDDFERTVVSARSKREKGITLSATLQVEPAVLADMNGLCCENSGDIGKDEVLFDREVRFNDGLRCAVRVCAGSPHTEPCWVEALLLSPLFRSAALTWPGASPFLLGVRSTNNNTTSLPWPFPKVAANPGQAEDSSLRHRWRSSYFLASPDIVSGSSASM